MRSLVAKWLIISLALLALGACSAVRLGYNNGPTLALWWLDGWLDLDAAQEARARADIERWFAWHRATQLPDYAGLLQQWQARAGADVTGAEVCAWTEQVRQRFWTGLEAALPMAAAALPDLTEPQWQHLQRRQAERLAQAREDYLQPRREDRLAAALERAVERAEDFYGPLLPAQRDLLAAATAASPLAPESWLAQREARQRTLVQALREAQRLPDPARRLAALRVAADAYGRRPPGAEGERQARWQAHNCETAARLHASATPAQREHLRDRLAAWEEDLRALAAAGAP